MISWSIELWQSTMAFKVPYNVYNNSGTLLIKIYTSFHYIRRYFNWFDSFAISYLWFDLYTHVLIYVFSFQQEHRQLRNDLSILEEKFSEMDEKRTEELPKQESETSAPMICYIEDR
jgi:hypothetical protein